MTSKEKILKTVQDLPDDVSFEDTMGSLLLLAKIERGILQADQGEILTHQAVKDRMSKWLK